MGTAKTSMLMIEELMGLERGIKGEQRGCNYCEGREKALRIEQAKLARMHEELQCAYESTIEGWARALELRDLESAGHSRRVTDMTLKLAESMGINRADQIHIRRGALLHDIGKMSIPDSILLKPGALTPAEWEIMKLHPVYAGKLLEPISFLQAARDIPLYHHEKWDGTGYPEGLKGQNIPLPARIFAVIDVYDALRSDRPYRKAWSKNKAIEYIRSQAGKHFDVQVTACFLHIIDQQTEMGLD
jgi:putative nucleotidyltransferase with HDIG domain